MNDPDIAISATGLLADFARAGALGWSGVHTAITLARLFDDDRPEVQLAAALGVEVLESGSVCLPLNEVKQIIRPTDETDQPIELPWPDPDRWQSILAGSPMVAVGADANWNTRPIRLVEGRLYLERCWIAEEKVRLAIEARYQQSTAAIPQQAIDQAFQMVFANGPQPSAMQRLAITRALTSATSVIAGGPGTGKTWTIAKLLRVLDQASERPVQIALAAFTGKAATRMQQAIDAEVAKTGDWNRLRMPPASTLHALLEAVPGGGFRRNADRPLSLDALIVDEMSMVSLPLMQSMLAALPLKARLILVGDPDQLVSVEAGAVLADIVDAGLPVSTHDPTSAITVLDRNQRFASSLATLPPLIREGQDEMVLSAIAENPAVEFIETDTVDPSQLRNYPNLWQRIASQAEGMRQAAGEADAQAALSFLDSHRLLCAHRDGPYGVRAWSQAIARALGSTTESDGEWYLGRPVLVTRNSHEIGVSNGDTEVVVMADGQTQVAIGSSEGFRCYSPWVLEACETMHALTVHKSQGSEYQRITLILPPETSPLLSRQLLYTAVTRAKNGLTIIGSKAALSHAVTHPAQRATGLATRLVIS